MSVADKLGTGSSFGHAPRGRSARGRAKAVAQGDVPAYELLRLRLDEVSPTPLNPRRNFGTDEELTRFGEELRQAQLAACVAVTRDAYLALWPNHEQQIGPAQHVLVNGERRYRSAVQVGLEALDFVVRDDLASSREQFINHLLKENLDREDFDVIERSRGVQQLVFVCAEKSARGSRSRAAEQLGRDRSWVTNQLLLLELPEELQTMLSAGSLPERDGRSLARHLKENPGLDATALLDHLKIEKAALAQSKEQERAALEAVRQTQAAAGEKSLLSADNKLSESTTPAAEKTGTEDSLSADNKPSDPDGSDSGPPSTTATGQASPSELLSADDKQEGAAGAGAVPKQQRSNGFASPKIALEDPQQIARDLAQHLSQEQMTEVAQLLLKQGSPR